jgi:hypothetical protein
VYTLHRCPTDKHSLQYHLFSYKCVTLGVSTCLEAKQLNLGIQNVRDEALHALYSDNCKLLSIVFLHIPWILHQITFPSFLSFILSFLPSFIFYISIHDWSLLAEKLERDIWNKHLHWPLALSTCTLTMLTNRHTINNWLFVFCKIWTVLRHCLNIMNIIIVVCMEHNNKHSSALWHKVTRTIQICKIAMIQNCLNCQCSNLLQKLMVLSIKPYEYINLKLFTTSILEMRSKSLW